MKIKFALLFLFVFIFSNVLIAQIKINQQDSLHWRHSLRLQTVMTGEIIPTGLLNQVIIPVGMG